MLIQREYFEPSGFWNAASKRQKIADSYFLYLIQSHRRDLNRSKRFRSSAAKFNLRSLAGASQRQICLYSTVRYNQSHTSL